MVINFGIGFGLIILTQILFSVYALTHKAKNDKLYKFIQISSFAVIILQPLNVICLNFGETGLLLAKICFSLSSSIFFIHMGIFTTSAIWSIAKKPKEAVVVTFITFTLVLVGCIISFVNLDGEAFFHYVVSDLRFFSANSIDGQTSAKILLVTRGRLWKVFTFFTCSLVLIYGAITFARILIRTVINSINDIFIICVFSILVIVLASFANSDSVLLYELFIYCYCLPILYYILRHTKKNWFAVKSLRSRMFNTSTHICVIFDADDLLVDFNNAAASFFGFTKQDIYNLSVKEFVTKYVPLGSAPVDNLFIEQFYMKGSNNKSYVFQINYNKYSILKKDTICSYFIMNDITTIVQRFTDIQHATMTDNLTGLNAQHVLATKIREINMYRRFPYTVATCSIVLKSDENKSQNSSIALIHVSECILSRIRSNDFAAYENGNIVLLFSADYKISLNIMQRIIEKINEDKSLNFEIEFKYGLASRESPDENIQEAINRSHTLMYQN